MSQNSTYEVPSKMNTARIVNNANTNAFDDRNDAEVRMTAKMNQPKMKNPTIAHQRQLGEYNFETSESYRVQT